MWKEKNNKPEEIAAASDFYNVCIECWSLTKPPPFSRFRKSVPASDENQGLTYIKIVSPTVFK